MRTTWQRVCAGWAAMLLVTPSAAASSGTAPEVVSRGCRELAAVVTVPVEQVRRFVPAEYELTTFPGNAAGLEVGGSGRVTDLMVRSFRCDEQVVDGVTRRNTTSVSFGPQVTVPDEDADMGFFALVLITNNPDLAHWLRRGTGAPQVHHVPGLRWTGSLLLHGGGRVVVDAPSPWPFRLEAWLTGGLGARIPLVVHWWASVPGHRTLRITNRVPAFDLGATVAGRISAGPGNPMAEVFGGNEVHAYFFAASFDEQTTTGSLAARPADRAERDTSEGPSRDRSETAPERDRLRPWSAASWTDGAQAAWCGCRRRAWVRQG